MRISALVVAAIGSFVAAPALAADDMAAQLDALVAPQFPAKEPGAVVLVQRHGQTLLRKAYGMADLELGVPMRPDYIFRLASLTKQFTATAIMILVDEGKVGLRDDLRKYVPEYPSHGPVVTIEQLLTHTSGVPDFGDLPAFEALAHQDLTHEQFVALIKDVPLDFPPSSKWKYSNSGYYLLGMVIERVSGKRYSQFLQERIFGPQQMTHTGYDDGARILGGRVPGYERSDRDGKVSFTHAQHVAMSVPFAAGGLVSSVDDLARWDAAITAGKVLQKASWSRMFTTVQLSDGKAMQYGFGWGIRRQFGQRVVAHSGEIAGFHSTFLRLPDEQTMVVILCNSGPPTFDLYLLALRLAMTAIGKPLKEPPLVKVAPAILDRYVGVYETDKRIGLVIRRDGDYLTCQRSDGSPLRIMAPQSETTFSLPDLQERLVFVSDASGRVLGVDVVQPDGQRARAARTAAPLPVSPP